MGIKKHSAPLTHTLRQVECRVVDGVIMVLLLRKDTQKNRCLQGQNRRERSFCISRDYFCVS
jgi:hypothetical protein